MKLNVGGKLFMTTKDTLRRGSFFDSILNGNFDNRVDEKGYILIDRDPDAFEIILRFLRTNLINFKKINCLSVEEEAKFYGVTDLEIKFKKITLSIKK